MKKILFTLVAILITLFIVSCSTPSKDGDINQRILAPKTNFTPIKGSWEIVDVINKDKLKAKANEGWVGKNAEFSNSYVSVGDYILYTPSFKIRRLNAVEYLVFNHKVFNNKIEIPSTETDVITITGKDRFLCEILKLDEKQVILEMFNYDLLLKKVSDTIGGPLKGKINLGSTNVLNGNKPDDIIRTGVLIGLRAPTNKKTPNSAQQYNYRTILIAAKNRVLHPILETKNIFFPRKSGFWKIGVNNINQNDDIYSYNISMNIKNITPKLDNNSTFKSNNSGIKNIFINYIGNDYISIENDLIGKNNKINYSRLSIVPIDSLPNLKTVNIADLTGKEGSNTQSIGAQNALRALKDNYKVMDEKNLENNFGLVRKSGHWYFEGRINYEDNKKLSYEDYRINIIPPSNLIFYDELSINWTDIKDKVPDAIDAITSPNRDLAIIQEKNNRLLIYEINNGTLGKFPIKQIDLNKDEKIIMAEWATGSYVENWEKSFLNLQ